MKVLDGDVAERYRDFAAYAEGDSPCFADWARRVAADVELHEWLASLDRRGQQPNLVFAAARWHGAPAPGSFDEMKSVLIGRQEAVKETIRTRATQTNEVGRLATVMTVLGLVEESLALLEVGASAGLCLYPDRYDYDWVGAGRLIGSGGPVLRATATGAVPVPGRHPQVAWRGGIDLNPLDIADDDAMTWLETLVWPEQNERRARLRHAIGIAREDPPRVDEGDLLDLLPDLVHEVAEHGVPVVYHSAVIAYLAEDERVRFHDLMTGLVRAGACRWISNEAPGVLPSVTGDLVVPPARFVVALDGRPVAFAHGHGETIEWL